MKKINLLFWLLIISKIAIGQTNKTVIPFELTSYNNISIKAILNEKDTVQLMFHTAANALTLTEVATKRLKSIGFDKTIDGIKSWGGVTDGARMSEYNVLQIEGLKWSEVSITENKNSGQFTDGKFGIDLFKGKVMQIDFEKKVLIISDDLPKKLKKYEKRVLTFENDYMFVEGICGIEADSSFSNKFLLHSGYAGSILLDDTFTNDHKLNDKLKIIGEKELKDSYGNIIKTKKAILPTFKIGNQTLKDVTVGFFAGAIGRQKMSSIGGDILKRFNWVIDAERKFVYLKPNSYFKTPYTKV